MGNENTAPTSAVACSPGAPGRGRKKNSVTLYRDAEGKWRWRFVFSNGRIGADSAEGYENRAHCLRMAEEVTGHYFGRDWTDDWKQGETITLAIPALIREPEEVDVV